jgi:hypothetical protein
MSLFSVSTWLKSPMDRDIISRWTVGHGEIRTHALTLPEPPDAQSFSFLALGDTGDSEATGPKRSPQDAVAGEMAIDSALPEHQGDARFIVHTGDVIYLTGERRLYDRNFREPYAAFLEPISTVDNLVFRLPFLPVPGNHDYYDLNNWLGWFSRLPFLGAGLRAISEELFAFRLPEGGSEMGKAYMQAFVAQDADTTRMPFPYLPGEMTQIPNRYYTFRYGCADFFALDSNTLDAPAPHVNKAEVQADAEARLRTLEVKAKTLDRDLRRIQTMWQQQRTAAHEQASTDADHAQKILRASVEVGAALNSLKELVQGFDPIPMPCRDAVHDLALAERRWNEATHDLESAEAAQAAEAIQKTLLHMDELSDESCNALSPVEGCLSQLPEGQARTLLLQARDRLQQALHQWAKTVTPTHTQETAQMQKLSEEALDVQRELALEKRRLRHRPEDHDTAQLEWLEQGLTQSRAERPDSWRIVYLHHPLYTTITNHCERPDVQGLRANLLAILQKHQVDLVLSGHSHTFEWFRSDALPHTGIFVTGGGGHISLRASVMEPTRRSRYRDYYNLLRENGVAECAIGGRGPNAADGEDGLLYHYLRIKVTPDALFVTPVGVRRLKAGYRREDPMPVFHVPRLTPTNPAWTTNHLETVVIRRGEAPEARWK